MKVTFPVEHNVYCYSCDQCYAKFDFLCDFHHHIQEHSENGRQYIQISFCGKYSRKEVSTTLTSIDNVLSVEYPDIDSWVRREENTFCDGYEKCEFCGPEYDIIYRVEHRTRQCFKHELEEYNDHKHKDTDKTSNWDARGYTFHPYYVGCRPETYVNHKWRVTSSNCSSVIVLAGGKLDQMDLIDRFLAAFPELKNIEITDMIPSSECYPCLKSYSFHNIIKPGRFKVNLQHVKKPSF